MIDKMQYIVTSPVVPLQRTQNSLQPQSLPNLVVSEIVVLTQKMRKVQDEQTRDLILNVLNMCRAECLRNALIIPLTSLHGRVAMYTNIHERTVHNIKIADQKRKANGQTKQPLLGKIKRRPRNIKTVLDDRDIVKIKNVVRDYYIKYRKVPVMNHLLPTILDQIPTYKHGINFLHKIFRNIGFKRKKYYSKRSVLLEDSSIVAYRNKYLKLMKQLKSNIDKLFYVYECVVDRSFTLHKSWVQKYAYNGALCDKNTFSFICAGSLNGFLKNSILLKQNDNCTEICSHPNQLSAPTFENWLNQYLIPNLPRNSIVIMDDGPHHCVEEDIPISYYSHKSNMCEYLKSKKVLCDENMRRSELYHLIELNKPTQKMFVVDNILKQHEHEVVRLPAYMVDLNPVQHAMDQVQQKLFEHETMYNFNIRSIGETFGKIMKSVTQEDWKMFFSKVSTLEDEFWEKDGEFEIAIDDVIFSLRDCIDNYSSEESDFDSEMEDLNI